MTSEIGTPTAGADDIGSISEEWAFLSSFDHLGTSPQRIITGSRRPSFSSRTTTPRCMGAKLKRGSRLEMGGCRAR